MAVYTQSEQFADKIAIRKNSRFERSFLLACLISPTKRSLPSSRPTPRESTKKRKKKSLLNQQCKREFAPTFTLFEEGKGSRCTFLSSSLLSHLSRNAFEILFHKTEKKKNSISSKEIVPRCFVRRLRTIVLTINFTTSLNIFNLRPFFLISFYLSNFLRS